jgi:DNA polymerase III sliding clamp (beta) subunit (PCNA family)
MAVQGNQVLFMPDEHTQLRSVIYAEDYPNVLKAMRTEFEETVKVRKEAFLEVLNRASNFAGGERIPSLTIFLGKEEIAVMMDNEEVGRLGDVLEVPGSCAHDRIEMKFTPTNLIDAVANCPNAEMDLHYDKDGRRKLIYVDGGSGYQAWVIGRTETETAAASA